MDQARLILQSMRPRQWVKNVLLLAGLYFPQVDGDGPLVLQPGAVGRALAGFVVFCLVAGSGYLINDLLDAPRDRQHPRKRTRPIASGRLAPGLALRAAAILAAAGLTAAYALSFAFGLCVTAYFAMEMAYCVMLKDVFLIDTLVISLGFIIRAVSGIIVLRAENQPVELTPWFVVCVLFLSLLLAFGKRQAELGRRSQAPEAHRPVLGEYSPALLNGAMTVCAGATILAYALYSVGHPRPWEMLSTLPFVIFGVFRYLHLSLATAAAEVPEDLFLGDPALLGCVGLWALTLLLVFYPVG